MELSNALPQDKEEAPGMEAEEEEVVVASLKPEERAVRAYNIPYPCTRPLLA